MSPRCSIALLSTKATAETVDKIEAVITDEAMVFLSSKLSTPLQFETYLTRSFEEGYKVGQKPVTVEVIASILAKDIDELEPRLTRHGYNAKVLAEVLNAKPREIARSAPCCGGNSHLAGRKSCNTKC